MNRPIQVYIQNILKSYKLSVYTKGANRAKKLQLIEQNWVWIWRCCEFSPIRFFIDWMDWYLRYQEHRKQKAETKSELSFRMRWLTVGRVHLVWSSDLIISIVNIYQLP